MKRHPWRIHRLKGDLYAFWAVTMAALLLVFGLVVVVGRYYFLRGQVKTAADAAALAAAAQIDIAAYENGQGVRFTEYAYSIANQVMQANCAPLIRLGGACYLADVRFDESQDSVRVTVMADFSSVLPKFIPSTTVTVVSYAEVAPFSE